MRRPLKRIPQDLLDSLIYDESSPSCLRWAIDPNSRGRIPVGSVAGCRTRRGYWVVKFKRVIYYAHRVVMSLHLGEIPTNMVVDHQDRDGGNNKIENLRVTDWETNSRNNSKSSRNKSGETGVILQKGRGDYLSWVAFVTLPRGRDVRRTFGVNAYGFNNAFNMAVQARAEMLNDLREAGVNYSPTHGK